MLFYYFIMINKLNRYSGINSYFINYARLSNDRLKQS